MIKRTERGWGGHFVCAAECLFRRNTLLEDGDGKGVVVSTVGGYLYEDKIETIGHERYYETMVFPSCKEGPYIEADTSAGEMEFTSPWSICAKRVSDLPPDVDNRANDMHEAVVDEFIFKMENGELR